MPARKHRLLPRKRPLQPRSELTRERILSAAEGVFGEYGYRRGTTNRIAQWAEISIGSLYQYYPNKDAIIVALAARHLDAGLEAAYRRLQQGTVDSLDNILRAMVRTVIDNHRQNPTYLRVLIEETPRTRELSTKIAELQQAAIADVRRILVAHPDVDVADKDAAAHLVATTVHLVVHHSLAAPNPLNEKVFENELVTMVTRYLSVRGSKAG